MSMKVRVHTYAHQLEHARNIYLTAFWRITPAVLIGMSMLSSACGKGQPAPSSPAPGVTASSRGPALTATSRPLKKTTPATKQPASPTLAVNSAGLYGTHIHFWYVLPGGVPDSAQANPLRELIDDFNRSNTWGIMVEGAPYESYEALMQQVDSPQGEDMPDLLVGYPYQLRSLDDSLHLLADLSPYVQDPRWGLSSQEQEDFNPLFWQQDVVSGKRLGLPFFRSAQVLYYNLSQAKELGFEAAPDTPAEFSAQACAAAQANRKAADPAMRGTGGWAVNTDVPTMEAWLYAFGSSITAPDEESYALSTTQTTRAFTYLKDLLDKTCAWSAPDVYTAKEFATRQALFISSSLAGLDDQANAFAAAKNDDAWTVIPFPSAVGKAVITAYGPSFAVVKSDPEKQLAGWLFSRWMVSQQNQARWIEKTASLPLGAGVLPLLAGYRSNHPQWVAAVDLLPDVRVEPELASWGEVRWSLSDAGGRLFSPLFPADLIPQLMGMLKDTAAELEARTH
jgi:ABC-type glycerol-3-phosphate transport system substrate-binding protein